jgi:YidC/Oxa1 family membrane protein insertase
MTQADQISPCWRPSPAGLVIYWAWNNTPPATQQSIIMKKHGVKIELFDNIKSVFGGRKKGA